MKKLFFVFLLVAMNLYAMDYISLPAPNLDRACLECVGIRPYRKGGIRLEIESFAHERKLIIHNYGQGGGGISLSPGCAEYALSLLNDAKKGLSWIGDTKIAAVLGAGVNGLTVASYLLEQGYQVHMYAQTVTPHTTSDVGAGIWGPSSIDEGETPSQKENYKSIRQRSLDAFGAMADKKNMSHPGAECVAWRDGYRIFEKDTDTMNPPGSIRDFKYTRIKIGDGPVLPAASYKYLQIDMSGYMKALSDHVMQRGANIEIKKFDSVQEVLQVPEVIIFNCTGLGSRDIFKDDKLKPIQGHIVRFVQEEHNPINYRITKSLPNNPDIVPMLIPWKNMFLIGTITQEGKDSLEVNHNVCKMLVAVAKEAMRID